MRKVLTIIKNINIKVLLLLLVVLCCFSVSTAYAEFEPLSEEELGLYDLHSSQTVNKRTLGQPVYVAEMDAVAETVINSAGEHSLIGMSTRLQQGKITAYNAGKDVDWYSGYDEIIEKFGPARKSCLELNLCSPYCYYKDLQGCMFCDLFKVLYNAASHVTYLSIKDFSASVLQVVVIGFAIWLAIQVLGFVSSPETRDAKDLIMSIIHQGFIVALVTIILNGGVMAIFNLTLEPVFNTGVNMAQATLNPTSSSEKIQAAEKKRNATTVIKQVTCSQSYGLYNSSTAIKGALPESMGNGILCTMTMVQSRAAKITALGKSSICYSWKRRSLFIIPHLGYLLTGIGLWIGGMLLTIAVPFMLIDSVVQLAVAGALLPAAIGAYAFKMTRGYTKQVWDTFVNGVFTFFFTSLIVLMLTVAFEQIISDALSGKLDEMFQSSSSFDLDVFFDRIAWFTVAFLKVVFVLVLTWSIMGEAQDFASQFSGSIMGTKIGQDIGTMGASMAKGAALKLGKPIASAAGSKLWKGFKRAGRGVVHGARRGLMAVQTNKAKKLSGGGTQNADGSTTYSYSKRNWLTGAVTNVSATVGGDGSTTITKDKTSKRFIFFGSTVESHKEKNKHLSLRSKTVGGKEKATKVRYNSDKLKKLFNKKNEFNADAFREVMDSGDEKFKIAALKTVMQQRMPGYEKKLINNQNVSQEALYDDYGNVVGYREVLKNGTVREMRFRYSGKRMLTELTELNSKGHGRRLSTDGIINKKETFKGQVAYDGGGNLSGIDINKDSLKSTYGLTKYYEQFNKQRRYNRIDYNESLFSAQDVKAAQEWMGKSHYYRNAAMHEFTKG